MAKNGAEITIPLEEEIEGDRDSTGDFVFVRVGASVPLKASNPAFDLQRPPSQPIAISQRHRLLFLAHPDGFFVARTDDVLGIAKEIKEKAKEIKEKGEGPSVEKASLVNVKVGRVSILAVSTDESTLAVAVDSNIFFYSTVSFLDKEQQLLFSCLLNDSCIVKDFKWQKNMEKSYVVLSNHGLLYHGTLEAELKNVMNNVDAVDWSPDGGFVAVARKSVVTILASNFKEVLNLSLLFESWPPIDSEHTVKVDSIRWLREDSVIIGCIQVNEDGEEESYLVQVIKSKEHNFSKASCNPVVYSFPDLFDGVWDILPTGCGPYLLANYLDYWEVILASNKKAIDQHISLFKWSMEDHKREVVSLEFCSDKYTPKIEVPENGDDNIVLGFCVEKFSSNEKIKIQVDDNFKEIYPRCTLLCLTGEGKLNLFHAARITDGSDLSQASVASGNNNNVREKHTMVGLSDVSTTIPRLKDGIENTSENRLKQINTGPSDAHKDTFEPHTLSPRRKQAGDGSHAGLLTGQFGTGKQPMEVPASHGSDFTLSSDVTSGAEVLPDFFPKRVEAATLVGKTAEAPVTMHASTASAGSGFYGSAGFEGAPFGSQSMGKLFGAAINPSSPPFSGPLIDESQEKIKLNNATRKPHCNKATQNKQHTQPFPSTGNAEMLPTFRCSQPSQEGSLPSQHLLEKIRAFRYPQKLDSEPEISKQFYNVKNMAQELDILLSFIEKKGGFKDACTLFQGSSLLALENALGDISEMSQRCKRHLEERVMEIQQLQSKMLQVSARQEYMRGIVEQASNKKYWDIWNQQKLNPELEAKRQNILNANQNLTNQIIELERHFNILEINRFGGSGRISVGHTAFQSGLVAARQRQSLQSVYNTLNSQLAAAEHLSECLSKQMSQLHLDLVSTRHQSIAKELLDSIGLSDEITSMQSPVCKRPNHAPATPMGMLPSTSNAVQEHPRKKTSSVVKAFEPETARRRKRESLDRNWATFEPPKTTVKRTMQVQRYRVGADKTFRKAKEKFDSQMEAFSIQQKRMQDSHLKLATEARSNSGVNLAKNIFSPPYILGSNSDQEVGTEKTSKSPPLMTPSLSGVSSYPSGTKELFRTGDMSSTEVTQVDYMSKPLVANNITSSRYSSSTISSPITPLNTRLIGEAKDPRGMNSNLTGAGTDGLSLGGHTKQLADSSKSVSSAANEGNIFSTVRAFASAGVNEKTTGSNKISTRNQVSEPILNRSSDAKVSVPTSSSSLFPFASPEMTFIKPSLTPVSTASISLGKSLPHTKPAGVNNETISGSASITASNNQSLSSSSFVSTQSKNTVSQATPAPTLLPPKSSTVASFDSKSEASNQLATESASTSAPSILPVSSSNSLYSKSQESSATTFISLSTASGTPTVTEPTLPVTPATASPVHLDGVNSKSQPAPPQSSASVEVKPQPRSSDSTANVASPSQPEVASSMAQVSTTTGKDERLDVSLSQGDEMEEEAPNTTTLSLDSLGGFGPGTTPSTAPKSNPFGGSFLTSTSNTAGPPLSSTVPAGEPFRPPSFSLPSAQPVQTSQPASSGGLSSNLGGGFSGFGQPAHVGVGQQALGSVLGSFGQSRQLGSGIPGVGFPSSSGFGGGGFSPAANSSGFSPGGGFASAATGGGFTSAASAGGGFAAAAAKGGGFASLASGGGFAGAAAGGGFGTATPPGGFATAATAGHGFGGAGAGGGFASGGFAGFGSNQGGGFSGFGGNAAPTSGKPPAELLTQMRK